MPLLTLCVSYVFRPGIIGSRSEPPLDEEGDTELEFVSTSVEGGWTSVTFARFGRGTDDSVRGGGLVWRF